MVPEHSMVWIAGIFPVLSIVIPFVLYYWLRRVWLSTLVVLVGTLLALTFVFTFHFWSWLLLYVFLCWLACWAANMVKSGQLFPKNNG